MPVDIRPAETAHDFAKTVPLLVELNGGDAGDMTADEMIAAYPQCLKHGYRHFTISKENEVVGAFGLSMRYDPTFFKPGCEMSNFIIAETHRSQGIGRKAMDFVEAYARDNGAGFVRFFVYPDNDAALKFYAGFGYRHTSNYMYREVGY